MSDLLEGLPICLWSAIGVDRMSLLLQNLKQTFKGCMSYVLKQSIGPYRTRFKWLTQTQWYSAEQHRMLQLTCLQNLITHAYQTVPFYQRLMADGGFRPQDIRSLEDIKQFPILTKADIQNAGSSLVSRKYSRLLTRTAYTGGTTGARLPLRRDLWSIGNEHAFVRRLYNWAGLSGFEPIAFLLARRVCPQNPHTPFPYAYDPVRKELILSVFHLRAANAKQFLEALRKYHIQALIGYPSAISILARWILNEKETLRLKAVLTTSETLESSRKKLIEDAFECRVFDFYGGGERVCYIHMCPQGKYHLITEYGLTEFLDTPDKTNVKKIISTGFWNWAMPLIRYDTGDLVQVGSIEECPCGRHYPHIERIIGRQGQILRTPSGYELGPTVLEAMMENILFDMKGIPVGEAQIIQEKADRLVLEYVPLNQFSVKDKESIARLARRHFPQDFQVEIRAVNAVRRTVSGKALSLILNTVEERERK